MDLKGAEPMSQRINRRDFMKGMGAGAAAALLTPGAMAAREAPRKRPNVVLVMTDDQGYGDLGCHGNKVIQTPHLDGMHGRSVRLTDYHVDPTCSPTRSALMTGRYSSRTGVWHTIMGRSLLGADEVTLGNVFARNGYRTGAFGKWHLGDNYPFRPQDRGFGETVVHGGGGVGQTPDYWGNDYFDDTYWHNGELTPYEGYCTDVFFDEAMRFIEAHKDRPFFVYLPTNAAHGPFRVAEKYRKLYADKPNVPNANFYGMITNIDENMGRLAAKLEALGLAEDTIVIFTTDNGTAAGAGGRGKRGFNAGMRGAKGSEYDGGHRVPCLWHWPGGGLTGGRDVDRLCAHVDMLPTLIDLCGLQGPKGVRLDGTSLAPLLRGKADGWPDRTLFVHSQRIETPAKWRKSAVMTQRWRLVNGAELYDMAADAGQRANVAGKHPDVVARLRGQYDRWWASLAKPFGEYCRIVLGSEHENPARLTCHDWHGGRVPWHQGAVRGGSAGNGFWAVEIARDGTYEFALRRWPEEVDKPITAAIERGRAISATKAKLSIGGVEAAGPIAKGATAVRLTVTLKAGPAKLQTWLTDEKTGQSRGAYFVYVKRLD